MKKILIQILSAVLLSLFCACHAEIENRDCMVAVSIVGGQRGMTDYSYNSALNYQYQIQLSGTPASESEWVSFSYPQVDNLSLRKGKYELYVRAVKNGEVFSSGSQSISVSDKESNSFTVVMHKNNSMTGKGFLNITENGNCSNLNVEITYDGPEYKVVKGAANESYSQELDNGFYIVSIVYKNGDEVVGGQAFSTYVEAYSTGSVSIETGINEISRSVEVQFYNLSAPHVSGKVCVGYELDGEPVVFPKTFETSSSAIPTYQELGLEPVYKNVSDVDEFLKYSYLEIWTQDITVTGRFINAITYPNVQNPQILVVHGSPPMNSFSNLKGLKTVVLRDAEYLYVGAFKKNPALTEIYIESEIKAFDSDVFLNSNALTDIYLEDSDLSAISFPDDMDISKYTFHFNCDF